MIPKIISRIISLSAVILIVCLSGCKDMFKDPLSDKNTGNKVTVLLMDRNFIKTKIAIRLEDNATQKVIDQEPVEIHFLGDGAAHLITFTGDLKTIFTTSSGFIEVGYDPNILISDQKPLELTVIAVSPSYVSAPQFLSYTVVGLKNLTIKMVHKITGKSISSGPFSEPYDLNYNGVLHSAQLKFMSDISTSPTGTAWDYINLYNTAAAGSLTCNNLTDHVLYSDFGAYYFGLSSGLSLVPPANPTKNVGLQNGDFVYSSVLRTGVVACEHGLTIHVERPDGKAGTAVFDYLITFSDGTTKSGQVTCSFPSDNLIEQIYYPSSSPAVSVGLLGDAQYSISAAVNLSTPCGATANFTATPKSSLQSYKFITTYLCADSHVGMGFSIIGEFRKDGTSNPWTRFEFKEGICELQMELDADYQFRVNIDGEYHTYTIPTDPAKVQTFLIENQGTDYTLRRLLVEPTATLVTITVDVEFSQGVCDKIR